MFILTGLLLVLDCINALYPPNSDVIELTDTNFNSKVLDSNNVWVVEFFAPWCGHCQQFASDYSKAATALKGVAKVGAIDCDKHKSSACSTITGFPTVKIYNDKKNPTQYSGQRNSRGVVDAALEAIKQKTYSQLSGGASQQKSESVKDVIELTDDNFDRIVLNSDDVWLVEFFAPWCGHCKNLAPEWAAAASKLKGKVKLGALDATAYPSKAAEYRVQGYPTIKYFPAGKKTISSAEDYNGGRSSSEIVAWALERYEDTLPTPEVIQITGNKVLKDACEEHALCVISVLPHILDCQSECRNRYLSILQSLAESFKRKQWGWVWSEAGSQPELESALEIGGFGYPAMALLNQKKMKYSLLKGSFSESGISEFLSSLHTFIYKDIQYGRGSTSAVKGASLPVVNDIELWDGKDGELPSEEDIDLSDVDLNEKDEL